MGTSAIGLRHLRSVYRPQGNWALIQDTMMLDNNGPYGQTPAWRVVGMALEAIFTGTITPTITRVGVTGSVTVHGRAYAKHDHINGFKIWDLVTPTNIGYQH